MYDIVEGESDFGIEEDVDNDEKSYLFFSTLLPEKWELK